MLKFSYENMDAVPENIKGAYVADSTGRAVLDKLSDDHPKMVENKNVIAEKDKAEASLTSARSEITKLQNIKATLENKAIPEGFIVVKADKAPVIETIEKLEAAGVKVETLPALQTELDTLKREKAETDSFNLRKGAAEKLGYNADAFAPLASGLDIVKEGEDFFYNTKTGDTVEKKPLTKEAVEAMPSFKPFLSSLTTKAVPGNAGDPPVHSNGNEPSAEAKARAANDFKSMF